MAQIDKPGLHFNAKIYTGTGSSNSLTGLGFQPDLVWIKSRSSTHNHFWHDAVRGVTKAIFSNLTSAEDTGAQYLTAFGTDGFTIGTNGSINTNGHAYASWSWKAGNSAGSSNSDGSITSTVSANTTAGFSIVKYTGTGSNATVGHGLGAVPQVVLIKELNGTNNWIMSHQPLSASLGDYTRFLTLNSTAAVSGAGNVLFQGSAFTSSVFNVGTSAATNGSGGANFIAYCFAEKTGYSKFGFYTGNNNADGPFIYTGFKPALVIIKRTDSTNNWGIFDDSLNPSNSCKKLLLPNASNAEDGSTARIDMYSNGFKPVIADPLENASGGTHIYMAIAANPIVGSNNVPAVAR